MAITYNSWITGDYIYTSDGGSFSSNNAAETAFDYFPDDAEVDDVLYFGDYNRFDDIKLYVGTAFAADSVTFIWEYYTGSWTELTVTDNTSGFTVLGENTVDFFPPDNWTQYNSGVNNQKNKYWVRCRITAITNPTEGGAQSTQTVAIGDNIMVLTGYSSVTPATFYDLFDESDTQGWDVIDRTNNYLVDFYKFYCRLNIGEGSTTTYLTSTNECIAFGKNRGFFIKSKATFTLGTKVSDDVSTNGSYIGSAYNYNAGYVSGDNPNQNLVASGGVFNCYGSILGLRSGSNFFSYSVDGSGEWQDFTINESSGNGTFTIDSTGLVIRRVRIMYPDVWFERSFSTTPVDFIIRDNVRAYQNSTTITLRDSTLLSGLSIGRFSDLTFNLIDSSVSGGVSIGWGPNYYYKKWSFSLKVTDVDGNAISGALVTINDAQDSEVFSDTTDASGDITTQELIQTYGYQDCYTGGCSGTDIFVTKTPHTVTISKAGYQTKTIIYTMDRKREEIETLEPQVKMIMPMGKDVYLNLSPANSQNTSAFLKL